MALRKTFEEEVNTDTAEIYLCFFHNVGCVFDLLVRKLELTELCTTEEIQKATKDTTKSTSEKWVAIFQNVGKDNMTNMFKIVSFVRSVPGSNAFVERIFSLMANKWSDSRNRCSTELIKNELLVTVNCDLSCKELVRSSKKYPWKQ